MDLFNMGDSLAMFLRFLFAMWNVQVNTVYSLLGQSPVDFNGGGAWQIMNQLNPIFVAVGTSLVVIFFVIGFCSESIDIKEEIRFETILRMMIRVGIAEWLVVNNVSIMQAIFTAVGNLVVAIQPTAFTNIGLNQTELDVIKNLSFPQAMIMTPLCEIMGLIVLICGFFLIYTVYFRVLKILILVPLGSLAFATTSGNRILNNTAITYARYFVSVVLEAVVMALALIFCNAFISSGLPTFVTNGMADWLRALMYVCELTFTVAMTVGSVKGAQVLVSKALGL